MRMSRAGLEADMRHVVTLVLLVDRLDDPDPSLRLTAANLLIGMLPVKGSSAASSAIVGSLRRHFLQGVKATTLRTAHCNQQHGVMGDVLMQARLRQQIYLPGS